MTKKGLDPGFDIPLEDDSAAITAIICRGTPKVGALIRILAELVVQSRFKSALWSSLPANQLLFHGICELLRIRVGIFTANKTIEERMDITWQS